MSDLWTSCSVDSGARARARWSFTVSWPDLASLAIVCALLAGWPVVPAAAATDVGLDILVYVDERGGPDACATGIGVGSMLVVIDPTSHRLVGWTVHRWTAKSPGDEILEDWVVRAYGSIPPHLWGEDRSPPNRRSRDDLAELLYYTALRDPDYSVCGLGYFSVCPGPEDFVDREAYEASEAPDCRTVFEDFPSFEPGSLAGSLTSESSRIRLTLKGLRAEIELLPTKGCCLGGGRCEEVAPDDACADGTLLETGSCLECPFCPEKPCYIDDTPRACCLPGKCDDLTAEACSLAGGVPLAKGSTCKGKRAVDCRPFLDLGGCCGAGGVCSLVAKSDCPVSSRFFPGGCPSQCPLEPAEEADATGACLLSDGDCEITTEKACTASPGRFEGRYLGDGSTCTEERVCCDSTGGCDLVAKEGCKGRSLPSSVSCEPDNPCSSLGLGGCCDGVGPCRAATEAECQDPLIFLPEGCAKGCPKIGACRDVPCPRSQQTICGEATEADCTAVRGRFEEGASCELIAGAGYCPPETPCDALAGTSWSNSCGDVITFALERDLQGWPVRGSVRRTGSREVTGQWLCAAGDEPRFVDISWSGEASELRAFQIREQMISFADPGPDRLHWSASPISEGRRGAEIETIAKNGDLELELPVTNCGSRPLAGVSLLWQGEGEESGPAVPGWLEAKTVRLDPPVLRPGARGVVRIDLETTDVVELGDWASVSATSQDKASPLRSEHRFVQVKEKRLVQSDFLFERADQ